MKTLNQTLRSILLFLSVIGSTSTTFAYDFVVKGIYYNIYGNQATVTYKNVENIGSTWRGISDYKGMIVIPESVTFNGVNYKVTAIGQDAFRKCTEVVGVAVPNTITSIGNSAFYNCTSLRNINLPDSLKTIGSYAFYNCYGITCLTIPDSITTLGSYTFYNCNQMTNVTIGKSVTSIDQYAFANCSGLKSIICLSVIPPVASGFPNTNTAKLYVPRESVELYRTSSGWNYFKNVYGFGNDSFSIPDNSSFHGDTIVIPVSMQNESNITAFQTDVYLPDGFELVKKNNEYLVSLSDRKGRDHVIMVNDAPDGALRVLSYSPTLKAFKNNEGDLFYITVKVSEGVSGNFPIWLRNTILTSTDEEELYAIDVLSNVSVTNIIKGDVDNSGDITVADVVITARYILNYNPEPFIFDAADLNGDGKITITDVVKIANLVLDADYGNSSLMMPKHAVATSESMNGAIIKNGSTATVNVSLENSMEYTAFQFDVTLPQGMSASDFALAERADDLGLRVRDHGNGRVRVIAYSPTLNTIKGDNGNILSFNVMGENDILIDNIALVTPEGETIHVNGFALNAGNVTGTEELTTVKSVENVNYFNLAGQQLNLPNSGVNIVVTTFDDGSKAIEKVIVK